MDLCRLGTVRRATGPHPAQKMVSAKFREFAKQFRAFHCSTRCVRCARSCSPYVHGLIHHHFDGSMTAKALVSRGFPSPNRA